MTILYIAEKPSAALAVAEGIGGHKKADGYYDCGHAFVSWARGHLFEQAEPDAYLPDDVPKNKKGGKVWRTSDLPIIPGVWIANAKKDTKPQLAVLGKLISNATEVVHAGDPDREGQAIVDDVLEHFNYTGDVKRLFIRSLDEVSVKRGLDDLKANSDYSGMRDASKARSRADWLIGMNLTRALTLATQARGDNSLLVVGRVQSPTLALVVRRDDEIRNFKAIDHYYIDVTLSSPPGDFTARWIPAENATGLDDDGRLISRDVANASLEAFRQSDKANITAYEKTPKSTPQPLGLALSDITLVGSNKFGMTAEDVLKTVQSLYESKLCSYPRSDCSYLPLSQLADAPDIIAAVAANVPALAGSAGNADVSIQSRIWNDKKITAHHAIVPTQKNSAIDKLTEGERNIYELICRNYLAQFYPKYEYDSTIIEATTDPDSYLVRCTGKTETNKGWKAVYQETDGKNDTDSQTLPVVEVGEVVGVRDVKLISKKTTPPKHYTEGTLIKTMENIHRFIDDPEYKKLLKDGDGIGTSATRSTIISELKRRNYLEVKGKSLISSTSGQRLVKTLPDSVTSAVFTAQYENEMKGIEAGTVTLDSFVKSQVQYVTDQVNGAADSIAKAPPPEVPKSEHSCTCGGGLSRRKGTKGFFWGCSSYPDCTNTFSDKRGKPDMTPKPNKGVETEYKCLKCDSSLIERKSNGGKKWFGCSTFPKCKERYFEKDGAPDFKLPEKAT